LLTTPRRPPTISSRDIVRGGILEEISAKIQFTSA
jgi:hypothetical protein